MMSFCVKCKRNTDSINAVQSTTKNNRPILKSNCGICGSKKSQFLSIGKGIFNNALSNLGVELHLPASKGEEVSNGSFNNLNKYSYCGPGTKYEQRDREGYKGINELDKMCKLHDKFYDQNTDTASRNISDVALAHRADEIARNPMYDHAQRKDANFISGIMKTKAKYGLGITKQTSKNLKRGPMAAQVRNKQ